MTARKILLLNGPNLDMLGTREPEVYGLETLATLEQTVRMYAEQHGATLTCFQSNSEGKLIGKIHAAAGKFDGIVYNPGAHTHYSYALRDAIASIDTPVVEVHLSDIDLREPFRSISVIAPVCVAQIKGMGVGGYCRALDVLLGNEGLPRLGEGYERHFAPGESMRIAGRETIEDVEEPEVIEGSEVAEEPEAVEEPEAIEAPGEGAQVAAVVPAEAEEAAPEPEAQEEADQVPPESAEQEEPDQAETAPEPTEQEEPENVAIALIDFTAEFADDISQVDMGAIASRRQSIIRAACSQLGLNALLVRDTSNVRWATGFDGVFDEERAHALLVAPDKTVLHTDTRYSNAIRARARLIGSGIAIDDARIGHFEFARNQLVPEGEDAYAGRLGIEDSITYAEFVKAAREFSTTSLAPTSDVVLSLRSVKDATEIKRLRAAQAVTDAAFDYIVSYMRPGMTEREVQLELESFMLRHGADGLAFSSIVACGENGADPHAIPGDKKLEAGQCVVMDFGARAFGYCSDMTRMVFLGEPRGDMARAWNVLRQTNEAVENMIRPGVGASELHELAERLLADGGFGGKMGHGIGHGVGIDCHELPTLNARSKTVLAEGNVVTVEPGIYLPGVFGMRLEDCGVVTAEGFDVFSKISHETIVI